jgi:carboxylesterase
MAERGWRVVAMRLPGHGTSPKDFEKTTAEELIEAVRSELARLNAAHETTAVVTHSMGGSLATLAVAEEGADALVLGAPYFGVTYRWYYLLPPETWTNLMKPIIRWVYKGKLFIQVNCKEAKQQIDSYTWVPTRGAATLTRLGELARRPETLAAVQCPVLLLHSRGDVAAAAGRVEEAFAGLGSSEKRLVWLTDSNHHIYWDCDAETVKAEIVDFLELL